MNELRLLKPYDRVVEVCGGGKPTRYVWTHQRGLPPTGETWEWIQEFEGCSSEEAKRLEGLGRQISIYEDGAVLVVNGEAVLMVGGSGGTTDVKRLLEMLK